MRMNFLPFPRGATAKGDKGGDIVGSDTFFSTKEKPLLNALVGETEPAQILISAAFLDKALERCLNTLFKASGTNCDQRKELIGSYRNILGTFGAKIPVCRGFGLLEKGPADTLEAIKDIRNAFAHFDFAVTLESDEEKIKNNMETIQGWLADVEYKAYEVDNLGNRIPMWVMELIRVGEIKDLSAIGPGQWFLGAVLMLYIGIANIQWAIDPASYDGAVIVGSTNHINPDPSLKNP